MRQSSLNCMRVPVVRRFRQSTGFEGSSYTVHRFPEPIALT